MKSLRSLLLLCSIVAPMFAAAPHPSVLTVSYRDKLVPVVKVIGTDPVVMVDSKEKRLRMDPTYLLQGAEAYGPGYVQLARASMEGIEMKVVATVEDTYDTTSTTSGGRSGTVYFTATFKSRETLNGGFVVVAIYSLAKPRGQALPSSRAEVIVHSLPDLPAGKEVPVKITGAIPDGQSNQRFFVQIFDSSGREIATNALTDVSAYYALRDQIKLQDEMKPYLAKYQGSDHALVPALMPKPIFREGTTPPKTPVSATLTVEANGTVSNVSIRGVEDPAVLQSITDAVSGWLFLPQLKAGVPVATKVQVPLQF